MRRQEGRPTQGMRPRVLDAAGAVLAPALTTLLVRHEAESFAPEFRHLARRTHDPRLQREAALILLAERYYQHARDFSGQLTATVAADSPLAVALVRAGRCVLAFAQDGQAYTLPCTVERLGPDDPAPAGDLVAQRPLQPGAPPRHPGPRLHPPLAGGHHRARTRGRERRLIRAEAGRG